MNENGTYEPCVRFEMSTKQENEKIIRREGLNAMGFQGFFHNRFSSFRSEIRGWERVGISLLQNGTDAKVANGPTSLVRKRVETQKTNAQSTRMSGTA